VKASPAPALTVADAAVVIAGAWLILRRSCCEMPTLALDAAVSVAEQPE
jgi:hypothetical protein